MAPWDSLIRFVAVEGKEYWASIPLEDTPAPGLRVKGYASIETLESDGASAEVTVEKV